MTLSVTLNPCVDRTVFVDKVVVGDRNRINAVETDAGGKGVNVARVLRELGAQSIATGFLGGAPGEFVKRVLNSEDVANFFVDIEGETRINFAVEQQAADSPPTAFSAPGPVVSLREWGALLQAFEEMLPTCDYVSLGGSIPPGLGTDAYANLMRQARDHNCLCVVDADGFPMQHALTERPFMVKPNAAEASRLLKMDVDDLKDAMVAAQKLHDEGVAIAIVSVGALGAVMVTEEDEVVAVPPEIEAVSTIGSGDSLVAGVLYGIESGLSAAECLRWGVAAGSATAKTSGADICRLPSVRELLPQIEVQVQSHA